MSYPVKRHITNRISRVFGRFASKEFPSFVQSIINKGYVKIMGLDMSEFHSPNSYKSLNALFTRELASRRDFDSSLDTFISPTDSLITECGELNGDTALQIKGMSYSVAELLTDELKDGAEAVKDGGFINFYLSPKDYHRYHSPYTMHIKKLIHVPGKLYPVNKPALNKTPSLFVENERVVLECEDDNGIVFYLIFVGALNVGQMVFSFDDRVETNSDVTQNKVYEYENLRVNKGDCLGWFKMGSTAVLITPKDYISIDVEVEQNVKFGQDIARLSRD